MKPSDWDRYADDYHDHILSPLADSKDCQIACDLDLVSNSKKKTAADIGTGRGDLIPALSERFKLVYAIDFSSEMLKRARSVHHAMDNVSFIQADIRNLTKLKLKMDVACAVNSILIPSALEVNKALSEIFKCLKRGGVFLGVFPSMEAVLYNTMLIYEREYKKEGDRDKAMAQAKKISEHSSYDLIRGIYDDSGEKQKFYYEAELKYRLQKAGFRQITFLKVHYPWGKSSGGYEDFFGAPEMWDWYVKAKK